jgi:metal-responsive CopG/Arc/MetJ family transcriptional regulator
VPQHKLELKLAESDEAAAILESGPEARSTIVSFHIPTGLLHVLDRLVEKGMFHNRSEAIRFGVYLLVREFKMYIENENKMMVGYR